MRTSSPALCPSIPWTTHLCLPHRAQYHASRGRTTVCEQTIRTLAAASWPPGDQRCRTLIGLRFIAEALVVSPNNLTALRVLSEHQVMMASGLLGLLRSIAGTLGPALSAVFWDQRYGHHINRYAENTPADALGLRTAMLGLHNVLTWIGELAAQIPTKAMALLHQRLLAEASTAAWQDYLLLNAVLALLCLTPALLASGRAWKRAQPVATAPPRTEMVRGGARGTRMSRHQEKTDHREPRRPS